MHLKTSEILLFDSEIDYKSNNSIFKEGITKKLIKH